MKTLIKNIQCTLYKKDAFFVEKTNVCITDDKITGIGEIPPNFVAEKIIDGTDKLLIPGLINSHTHAYMTVFRNSADDLMFNDWLFGRIMPMEDKLERNDSYWGAMLGIIEMLRSGTTCYLDMYIFSDENAQAALDSGIRAVLSRGLSGSGDNDKGGARRLVEAKDEILRWRGKGNGRLNFMLAPHAPYTCGPEYIKTVAATAKELGVGIHTHISESRKEIIDIKEQYGCSPVEYMENNGLFEHNTVAAHCVHLSERDIDIFSRNNVNVATNPVSNLKLANGVAPVPKLLDANVNVCIGTDGAASNNSLNLFKDLSFLTLIHKGVNENAVAVSANEGLKIATLNGAKALGLEGVTGEIKVGMKADLSIISLDSANLSPSNNLIATLSYSANGSEVETVIVDGKILMESRELLNIDEEKVRYEVAKTAKRIGTWKGSKQ